MNEDGNQDSLIHMRVSRELKGRWIALSRKEGVKLTDWIIQSVEKDISAVEKTSLTRKGESEHT